MTNGKRKGNQAERDVANWLSQRFEAYTGVKQSFRRAPDSGSWFGGLNSGRIEQTLAEAQHFGDLICPVAFRWSVEIKSYREPWSLNSLLSGKIKQLDGWLEQVMRDAANAGKQPMLVCKFNGCQFMVWVQEDWTGSTLKYKSWHGGLMTDFFSRQDTEYFLI